MAPPFPAYKGDNDYVFVCYSHADTDAVYADLQSLRDRGLRIWYDEGISPGTEWSEELAQALSNSSMVLFFASNSSVKSRHCRDEINFSHNHDKRIIVIELEPVEYPAGLELSLSSTQAVQKHNLETGHYYDKLLGVLPPGTVGSDSSEASSGPSESGKTSNAKKFGVAAALLVLLVGGGTFISAPEYWTARWIMFSADNLGTKIEQNIGFATTKDDVRIAYATTGAGPPVVIVLGWATHLEDGMMSPAYDGAGVLAMSSEVHTIIRYDGRGFGLSDRNVDDFSLEARVADLEAVVADLGLERFALYAMSAGGPAGIAYAAKYPEKVSSLVLASTNADFSHLDPEQRRRFESMYDTFENNWDNNSVRKLFFDVLNFNSDGDADTGVNQEIFSEFLGRSADGASIKGFFTEHLYVDASERAKQLEMPTLVIHGKDDKVVEPEAGRRLASLIRGATFKLVEGGHQVGTGGTLESRRMILDFIDSHAD
jgi:pimeloyl-ACP methyl ester carboxylesterase